jgi:2-hydroxy-6-oxonona-2,4-dienedioate hydrolase
MSSAASTSAATGRWATAPDLGSEEKHDTPFPAHSDRPRCRLPRPSRRNQLAAALAGPAQRRPARPRSDRRVPARPSRARTAKRRLLDRWTVVDGDTIHSRETVDASAADARLIILVHGVGTTARYFGPLLRELDGKAPAAAVELPGIGGSSAAAIPRDIPQQADVLAEWVRATGRHPAVLVGNSMGAQTVVELAIRHPALVERLVLIGPTMDPAARSALRQIGRLLLDATAERPSLIALTFSDTFRTRRRAVYRYFRAALDHHIEERIPLVSAPVLVVRGNVMPSSRGAGPEASPLRRPRAASSRCPAPHTPHTTGVPAASRNCSSRRSRRRRATQPGRPAGSRVHRRVPGRACPSGARIEPTDEPGDQARRSLLLTHLRAQGDVQPGQCRDGPLHGP